MLIADLCERLAIWAASKPLVMRAWIFGSRARSEETLGSDLDIAIELDLSAVRGVDDSGGVAAWMFEANEWELELADLFPFEIDLEQFMGEKTPVISAALARSSCLAYTKTKIQGRS